MLFTRSFSFVRVFRSSTLSCICIKIIYYVHREHIDFRLSTIYSRVGITNNILVKPTENKTRIIQPPPPLPPGPRVASYHNETFYLIIMRIKLSSRFTRPLNGHKSTPQVSMHILCIYTHTYVLAAAAACIHARFFFPKHPSAIYEYLPLLAIIFPQFSHYTHITRSFAVKQLTGYARNRTYTRLHNMTCVPCGILSHR